MKCLIVHEAYRNSGGEDTAYDAEKRLLRDAGNVVVEHERDNHEIDGLSPVEKLTLPFRAVWARDSYASLSSIIEREKPDIAHFHNTFPLISPSAYYACREKGVPVVQTLHNYRIACPASTFYRDGRICKDCVQRNLAHGIVHACYRSSRAATAATALMLAFHRWRRTWTEQVDCYLALTQFSRGQFLEAGIPADKLFVKPNFLYHDPGVQTRPEESFVFVGRLSPEKGLKTLLRAWSRLKTKTPLRVIGDGPLRSELESMKASAKLDHVSLEGLQPRAEVLDAIRRAPALLLPSECFENFPMVIVEAFALGVPVITSRLGAMAELVDDNKTGLHFVPGNDFRLAEVVDWAHDHPAQMQAMGRRARTEYEQKYTADRNYILLMEAYRRAIAGYASTTNQRAESLEAAAG